MAYLVLEVAPQRPQMVLHELDPNLRRTIGLWVIFRTMLLKNLRHTGDPKLPGGLTQELDNRRLVIALEREFGVA